MTDHGDYWTIAEEILSTRQLEALRLYDRGLSHTSIAYHMGISRERAGQLVARAGQKIDLELRRRAKESA